MGRNPAFQRKDMSRPGDALASMAKKAMSGPPDATSGQNDDSPGDEGAGLKISGNDQQHDPNDIAVCPKCGCTFDDQSGDVIPEGHPQHPGADEAGDPTADDASASAA